VLEIQRQNVLSGLGYYDLIQAHRDVCVATSHTHRGMAAAKRAQLKNGLNIRDLPSLGRARRKQQCRPVNYSRPNRFGSS